MARLETCPRRARLHRNGLRIAYRASRFAVALRSRTPEPANPDTPDSDDTQPNGTVASRTIANEHQRSLARNEKPPHEPRRHRRVARLRSRLAGSPGGRSLSLLFMTRIGLRSRLFLARAAAAVVLLAAVACSTDETVDEGGAAGETPTATTDAAPTDTAPADVEVADTDVDPSDESSVSETSDEPSDDIPADNDTSEPADPAAPSVEPADNANNDTDDPGDTSSTTDDTAPDPSSGEQPDQPDKQPEPTSETADTDSDTDDTQASDSTTDDDTASDDTASDDIDDGDDTDSDTSQPDPDSSDGTDETDPEQETVTEPDPEADAEAAAAASLAKASELLTVYRDASKARETHPVERLLGRDNDWYTLPLVAGVTAANYREYATLVRAEYFAGWRLLLEWPDDRRESGARNLEETRDELRLLEEPVGAGLDAVACFQGFYRAGAFMNGGHGPAEHRCEDYVDGEGVEWTVPDMPWGGGFEDWALEAFIGVGMCNAGHMPGAPTEPAGWHILRC